MKLLTPDIHLVSPVAGRHERCTSPREPKSSGGWWRDQTRCEPIRDVRILELHLHPLDLDVLHLIYLGRHPGNSLPDSLLGLVWDVAVTCLEAPTPCGGARDRDTASLP